MRADASERLATQDAIRRGLSDHEFIPYYQPIVRAADGTVVAFEALARWRRADGTLTGPDRFIAVAEESGLIADLGGVDPVSWTSERLRRLAAKGWLSRAGFDG